MERPKLRLVEHLVIVVFCAATNAFILHSEVMANETPSDIVATAILPENLSQHYRNLKLLNYQPEQVLTDASIKPSRLASVESINTLPTTTPPEPKTIPQRLPSTYKEAQEFVAEVKTITGKVVTSEDMANALRYASATVQCVVKVETSSLNPYAIGAELELGPGGLHRFGKLTTFYKKYHNPFDPDEVFPFIEEQIALGDGNHWAGIRDGICK